MLCHVGENLVVWSKTDPKSRPKKVDNFSKLHQILTRKKNFSSISDPIFNKILITFLRLKIPVHQFSLENRIFLVQKMLKMFPYTFSFLSTYPNQKGPV